jgi:hypothetical protein
MPIDDKPIKDEITVIKKIMVKLGDISDGVFGGIFDFVRKLSTKERSDFKEVSHEGFVKESSEIISDILERNNSGLVISFDYRLRDIVDHIRDYKNQISKLFFIDAISYCQGKGTPAVPKIISMNKPDDFENLSYYTLIQLRIMSTVSAFVLVLSPHELLKYTDYNEAGVFFKSFVDRLNAKGIPVLFIYDDSADPIFKRILSDLVAIKKEITV